MANVASADGRVLSGLNEIKGTTKNYKIVNNDGMADFALVIPAMTPEELVNFDMGRIFSPDSDTVKVMSFSLDLPSNLSVPKQTESYFLSFTVEKNLFRNYLPGDLYNMYAVRGQFPVGDVIKGVQNKKTLFELVNLFKFYGGGTKNAKAGNGNVEIKVDDIKFDSSFTLKAPTYGDGKVLLSLGMVKVGGEYYPTDVKRIMSGKSEKLTIRSGADQYALSILLNDDQRAFIDGFDHDLLEGILNSRATTDFSQLTYALQRVGGTTTPTLLAQIAAPVFNKSQWKVTATPPKAVAGISPYATYLVLSEREAGNGIVPVSFKQVLWSTSVGQWQSSFTIPPEAMALIKGKSYQWEVLYLGADGSVSNGFNWDDVTHVTRNAVIF
jgi:hypothetical protein